jgi:hypothetical protein
MPRRRHAGKPRLGGLEVDQAMDLQIGPGARQHNAEELERLRELWFAHRAELMATGRPGSRPWAWWQWESGIGAPPPTPVDRDGFVTGENAEETWLRSHHRLTAWEERELAKRRPLFEVAPATTITFDPDLGGAS